MTNIWEFLLQTAEVTITAAILLIGQVAFCRQAITQMAICDLDFVSVQNSSAGSLDRALSECDAGAGIEAQDSVESALASALHPAVDSHRLKITSGLHFVSKMPVSVTDWLFVLYILGVLISILYYGLSYVRLRRILRRGKRAEEALLKKVEETCARYALSGCEVVTAEGIPSAFICGFFRPLLVVPAGEDIDEKILLHELCTGPMRTLCRMLLVYSSGAALVQSVSAICLSLHRK